MTVRNGLRDSFAGERGFAVILLGLCPAVAVCARLIDALWMSAGLIIVLVTASLCMALIARQPGEQSRSRWFGALVLSSFLTASFEVALLVLDPESSSNLGIYIPLLAVNCLVLAGLKDVTATATIGQTLSSAAVHGAVFAGCLILITLFREVLGAGTITLFRVGGFSGALVIPGVSADPVRALGMAGGGLLCLGYLAAIARSVRDRKQNETRDEKAGQQ
jgi:electron transport complex protein RnfE